MCGICGFTGPPDLPTLKRMANRLIHRGPDDEGAYADGSVNLGMRRLSIIDVATGRQPIANEDESVWVVMNGEIYNFQAIRADLEGKGHRFRTDHSDTEVIVHLYEELGEDFVHALNGMFAIALWDKRRRSLLLIRDRMGVKPLFYATVNGSLVFASEIKAILAHSGYSREMDCEALSHYFSFKNVPAPRTAFKGIRSLPPGEILVSTDNGIARKRWWRISFPSGQECDEREAQERIRELLEDGTRLRMISDVPIGAYLSGGVDSSAVVALMSKYSTGPVRTFSLGYEDELRNKEADLHYARKVSKAFGTEHHEYIMSWRELVDGIHNVIGAFDQPFSGTISTYFLTGLIREHVKVALSGDGADELFGSYLSHRVAQPMAHYHRLRDVFLAGTATEKEMCLLRPCDPEFLERLYAASGGMESRWRYRLCLFSDEEKDDLLTEEFKGRLGHVRTLDLLEDAFRTLSARDPLNRILEMEWNSQLPDQVLAFVDSLSMAHSVEIRSPFLDYRLVEFVASLPGSLKIRDGNVKDILKRSVEDLLPEGITKRPKEGFVLPVFDWLTGKLKDFCNDVLSDRSLRRHNLLKPEAVARIVDDYYDGKGGNAGKVWNLMMFQLWADRYFA